MGLWERGILEILAVKCGGSQRSCFFNKVAVIVNMVWRHQN